MKKLLMVILALICIVSIDKAYAANGVDPELYLCGKQNFYNLKKKSMDVKFSYELITQGDVKYFHIKVSNMQEFLEMRIGRAKYKYTKGATSFDITEPFGIDGEKVRIDFYGTPGHPCDDQYISTTYVNLPKYNRYSETDECIEYEEFPLCNRFYKGTIKNYTEFKQKLDEYIKSVNTKPNAKPDSSIFEKIAIFFEDHPLVLALIIIASVCGVIAFAFIKIRNKLKRAKIKF